MIKKIALGSSNFARSMIFIAPVAPALFSPQVSVILRPFSASASVSCLSLPLGLLANLATCSLAVPCSVCL